MSDLYVAGGVNWMNPITLLFLINVGIIVFVLVSGLTKRQWPSKWLEAMKQLGGLALAWGTFGSLAGLFQIFGVLEEAKEDIPFQMIMGGLKVGLITVLYGLIVFCVSQLAYIIFKLASASSSNQ